MNIEDRFELDLEDMISNVPWGLSDNNMLIFAAKYYDNAHCENLNEFYKDVGILINIQKILKRYKTKNIFNPRILINNVICFLNVFPSPAGFSLLFYKIDDSFYPQLKSILLYLDRCPSIININKDKKINMNDIICDNNLHQILHLAGK